MTIYVDLPRLSELVGEIEQSVGFNPWPDYWQKLEEHPNVKVKFDELEHYLGKLEQKDWKLFKQKILPRFKSKQSDRGWQQAFDLVSEAIAYSVLKDQGFVDLEFVPESTNHRTPDILCRDFDVCVACEVKTVNESDDEIQSRVDGTSRTISDTLSNEFFGKIKSHLNCADGQLEQYPSYKPMVFFVLNFDDYLHEYVDRYFDQISARLNQLTLPNVRLFFWARKPFESKMSKQYHLLTLHK
jgi:hypothetical protein